MFNVLIVEDEMLVRLGLKNSIDWKKFNMQVISDVSDGEEAFKILTEERIDILLTDIKMPKMDGIELISKIRDYDKRMKVVILTCLEEFEIAKKAIAYNVSDYILKMSTTWDEIESVLTRLQTELESDTVETKQYRHQKKAIVLSNAVFRELLAYAEVPEKITPMEQAFASALDPRHMRIAVMTVENYESLKKLYKDETGHSQNQSIMEISSSILRQYRRGSVICEEGRFIFLFSFHDIEDTAQSAKISNTISEHLRRALKTYNNALVFFGISGPYDGYTNIPVMYHEASAVLRGRYLFGTGEAQFSGKKDPEELVEHVRKILTGAGDPLKKISPKLFELWQSKITSIMTGVQELDRRALQNYITNLLHWPAVVLELRNETITECMNIYIDKLNGAATFPEAVALLEKYLEVIVERKTVNPKLSREVSESVRFIERNFHKNISLNDVAETIGITPNYLSSIFKKALNINYTDYLNYIRIEKAKELLTKTNLKVYEITDKVGFSDNSYFSKVFKKQTGLAPHEFKKRAADE